MADSPTCLQCHFHADGNCVNGASPMYLKSVGDGYTCDQHSWFSIPVDKMTEEQAFAPNWGKGCDLCNSKPTVNATGMCGPCTFGEADTVMGDW